ncbi:type II secretion system F family protein (plasmid) [Pontibacillus sp. ALD_SL1]|uniref:type II secretion system F family protein n=1 Tax=Pontibacillus sp. ALD_SL1 TaxID=2777185 RepID=UPI001A96DB71|nr:type II secretion system F family protein [Pontibacillus sp. ALD_SL1]QST02978.1 type II secretion system F family protein [Pontibacillus sp. ALD_SL1]
MFELSFYAWFVVLVLSIFLFLVFSMLFTSRAAIIDKRIESMNIFSSGSDEEKIMQTSLWNRLYVMAEAYAVRVLTKHMTRGKLAPLELKLLQAKMDISPLQHWAKKIIYTLGLAALGLLLGGVMGKTMLLIIVGAVAGFTLPDSEINNKIKKRQLIMKSELPDFLDLLSATAPSAKNLEDGIAKVCERSDGVITDEFTITLEEINAGSKTRDALKKMSKRCGLNEIDTLVSQINQAQDFGTGVEKTLIVQAEKMRTLKKQLAEIKARKASVLLLLPSMFLLITCLIMIVGPSVVALVDAGSMF